MDPPPCRNLAVRPDGLNRRFVVRNLAQILAMSNMELPHELELIRDAVYDYAAPTVEWRDIESFLEPQQLKSALVKELKRLHRILETANDSLFMPSFWYGQGLDVGDGPHQLTLTASDYEYARTHDDYNFGPGYPDLEMRKECSKTDKRAMRETIFAYDAVNLWYMRLLDNPLSPLFLHVKFRARSDQFPDRWWSLESEEGTDNAKVLRRALDNRELACGLVSIQELRSGYFFGTKRPPNVPEDHPVYSGLFDDSVLTHRPLAPQDRKLFLKKWGQYVSPRLQKILGFKAREGKPLRDLRAVHFAQERMFGGGSVRENLAKRETSGDSTHNKLFGASFLPNPIGQVVQTEEARTYCGAYSKDGSQYLTLSQDSIASVYSVGDDGVPIEQILNMPLHSNSWTITDCCFANTSNRWAAVAFDGGVYIAPDLDNPDGETFLGHMDAYGRAAAFSVAWSHDDGKILMGRAARVGYSVVDNRTGHHTWQKGHSDMNQAAWAAGSDTVFFGGMDSGRLHQYDLREKRSLVRTFVGHLGGLTSCDVHFNGVHVLTTAKDGRSKLWDVRMGSLRGTEQPESQYEQLDETYDQYRVRADYRQTLSYLPPSQEDHPLDESVVTYSGAFVVKSLVRSEFSPCGGYVASGSADGIVRVWKLNGTLATCLQSHRSLQTSTVTPRDHSLDGARASLSSLIRDISWHPKTNSLASSMFISSPDDGDALRERLGDLRGVTVGGAFTWQTFQPQLCGATVVHSVGGSLNKFSAEENDASYKPYMYESPEYFQTHRVRGDSGYSLSESWYETYGGGSR